jgi:hypothetical protein
MLPSACITMRSCMTASPNTATHLAPPLHATSKYRLTFQKCAHTRTTVGRG